MRTNSAWVFLSVAVFGTTASAQTNSSFFDALTARSVGPTNMGGRIADIAVYEADPRIFYVASASGGVFKTTNAGMSYEAQFQQETSMSLGAIAVSATNPDIVWAGTGEANSRNSTAWGDGVYKSTDGGKTWKNMGLKTSRHIGSIVVDPKNPDVVFVGALGNLWAGGGERGLYKTTDGGKTWTTSLKTDGDTGIIEIIQNPKNNRELFAGTLQRRRMPYNFISGGPGSGLWKSTDAGQTWRKITKGLPPGNWGRTGMDYFFDNPKEMVLSVERPVTGDLKSNNNPETSGGLFRSSDGGESWTRVNLINPRAFYFSIPRFDTKDKNQIWIPGVELHVSKDGGRTVRTTNVDVHADWHSFWVNPKDANHIIAGVDGGVYVSRDRGITWEMHDRMSLGQFYGITFDMRKPYWVYGGLQDNGSWGMPTQTVRGFTGPWDAVSLSGGDGFHVQVNPNDHRWVFSESQGGAVQRINQETGQGGSARPTGTGLRFNWSTPIILSSWNPEIVYIGSNRVHRSTNNGTSYTAISPDLTTNNPDKLKVGLGSVSPESTSAEVHCTIITISESARQQGIIWAGTDDGNVQVTQDDGLTWTNVTPGVETGLPKGTWVSRVTASKYAAGRCYVTFDNHRWGDFKPYVFMTEDFGKTWKRIDAGIPDIESCYVIKEGVQNDSLLYLGTEMGLYFSLDRGATWSKFKSNFPAVSVHDLAVHPRDLDLVVGTHGRSIWTINVSALESLTTSNLDRSTFLCPPAPVYLLGRTRGDGHDTTHYRIPNSQPNITVFFNLKKAPTVKPTVTIQTAGGQPITSLDGEMKAGLQAVRFPSRNLGAGTRELRVVLKIGDIEQVTMVKVEDISGNIQQTK